MSRGLNGFEDGRFGDFVKDDAAGFRLVQSQHLAKVPRDGFSFAVFIGREPNLLGLLGVFLQFVDELLFLVGNFISGLKRVFINAELFFLQVADVAVA